MGEWMAVCHGSHQNGQMLGLRLHDRKRLQCRRACSNVGHSFVGEVVVRGRIDGVPYVALELLDAFHGRELLAVVSPCALYQYIASPNTAFVGVCVLAYDVP